MKRFDESEAQNDASRKESKTQDEGKLTIVGRYTAYLSRGLRPPKSVMGKHPRMHKAHRPLQYRSTKARSVFECSGITSCKNQDVLDVPPVALVTIPKARTHDIEACTAVLLK